MHLSHAAQPPNARVAIDSDDEHQTRRTSTLVEHPLTESKPTVQRCVEHHAHEDATRRAADMLPGRDDSQSLVESTDVVA